MVFGLGRARRGISDALDLDGGGGQGFSGFFSDELNENDFGIPAAESGSPNWSGIPLTQDEWVEVEHFSVPAQEEYVLGSITKADGQIVEIGRLFYRADNCSGNTMSDNKVRFGYTTRAGRNSDYVVSGTISRLNQSTVRDRVELPPQPWGTGGGSAPSGRGSPPRARENDRLVIEQKSPNSGEAIHADDADTEVGLPIMFRSE